VPPAEVPPLALGDRVGPWLLEADGPPVEPRTWRVRNVEDDTVGTMKVMAKVKTRETALRREVDALRMLDHPAIPRYLAHGVDAERDQLWLVTTAIVGERLTDRLGAGPLDWREACALFRQLAGALAHLHSHGLVHRDVNPDAILVGHDAAQLIGFDLAMDAAELSSAADAPLGNLAYVAPEVIADRNHHAGRADLYALGCTLYEALTGKSAFPAALWADKSTDGELRMLTWKTRANALDPGEVVPPWLANLVRKATDPLSDKRLPDMDAFVGWLDGAEPSWRAKPAMAPIPDVDLRAPLMAPRPSFGAPTVAATRRATGVPNEASPPVAALYVGATALGGVTGLAISAVAILFATSLGL
jgi:serine/threonine protein kinase